jgi:hypothetical protein
MTNLEQLVEPLKREVAVPGTFDTVYPNTSDVDLEGSLADAFGAAQIAGYFLDQVITDPDAEVQAVTPDLSPAGRALVVIFAAERILTTQIMSLKQRVAYEAGPVKYETENSASVLVEILKQMRQRRDAIVKAAETARYSSTFQMQDMYADRVSGTEGLIVGEPVFYSYELSR